MDYLHIGASWLHLVATVVLLGYVGVLGLVVIPVLRQGSVPAACDLVVALERRALPGVALALVAFLATGVYLTVSDDRYAGAGEIMGSDWAAIVSLKHVVIAVLLGLGLYADGLIAKRIASTEAPDRSAALARLDVVAKLMTTLGAVVLLLTAIAADAR